MRAATPLVRDETTCGAATDSVGWAGINHHPPAIARQRIAKIHGIRERWGELGYWGGWAKVLLMAKWYHISFPKQQN